MGFSFNGTDNLTYNILVVRREKMKKNVIMEEYSGCLQSDLIDTLKPSQQPAIWFKKKQTKLYH